MSDSISEKKEAGPPPANVEKEAGPPSPVEPEEKKKREYKDFGHEEEGPSREYFVARFWFLDGLLTPIL